MRGEHTIQMIDATCQQGSSPHARGAPDCRDACEQRAGIIPACAGSTRLAVEDLAIGGDHPRMRGEHVVAGLTSRTLGGSSPHARGAPGLAFGLAKELGIIPACAGSTTTRTSSATTSWDHPRMRGEHT